MNNVHKYINLSSTDYGNACGVGFFSERFSPFVPCCDEHDEAYTVSELLYAQGYIEKNDDKKLVALQLKQEADLDFFDCCNEKVRRSFFLARPLLRLWASMYISLVMKYGINVWQNNVAKAISELIQGKKTSLEGISNDTLKKFTYLDLKIKQSVSRRLR